jgi:hypothetical protein
MARDVISEWRLRAVWCDLLATDIWRYTLDCAVESILHEEVRRMETGKPLPPLVIAVVVG